jgi:hypothetical protein
MRSAEAGLGAAIMAAAVLDLLLTILYVKIGDRAPKASSRPICRSSS